MGGLVGLIVDSFGGDFFLMGLLWWRCFSFGLVLVLVYVFSSTLYHSLTCCWLKQGSTKVWRWWRLLIGDGVSHGDDGIFLGIFDGLGFKSATWVSDWWLRFADQWLGFANWWLRVADRWLVEIGESAWWVWSDFLDRGFEVIFSLNVFLAIFMWLFLLWFMGLVVVAISMDWWWVFLQFFVLGLLWFAGQRIWVRVVGDCC